MSTFNWRSRLAVVVPLIFICGCGSNGSPVSSETSKYQAAEGESQDSHPPDSSAQRKDSDLTARSGVAARPSSVATPSPTGPPQQPSARPPASVNRQAPISNRPEDLLAFIRELESRSPVGSSREAQMMDFQRTQQQIIGITDQLLSTRGLAEPHLLASVEARLVALHRLSKENIKGAHDALLAYCDQLTGHSNPNLAERGRDIGIAIRLNALATGEATDVQPILDQFRQLLASSERGPQLLNQSREIASILSQSDLPAEAQQVYRETVAAFEGVQDPQLAAGIELMVEEANLAAVNVRRKFVSVLRHEEGADDEFMSAVEQLLRDERRGPVTVNFLLEQAAFTLESNKMEGLAGRLYSAIGSAFEEHQDADLAGKVAAKVERYWRRAGLVGQPFQVEGIGLDNVPLDWSRYQGKVVLVDFWATWCGPCLQELPNIKQSYEQYRDQGFEVIGVNLDENRQDVEAFFSRQNLPWPTVVSANPNATGMQTPLAVECGVEFIPFLVLVGRDGRVAALNVRGSQLSEKLAELLTSQGAAG